MLGKIEKLLQRCDLKQLHDLKKTISDMIEKETGNQSYWDDKSGSKSRREERFDTNLLGTLTRITDVKPGERKEYSVTVNDISRSGMCLKVDTNFVPSRVVEVTFASPGGKIKRCFMEVVRVRKITNEDGSWLEVGCRGANTEEVRRLRLREEQVTKTRSKLNSQRGIFIILVGDNSNDIEKKLTAKLKIKNYSTRRFDSVHQAVHNAKKLKAQLAIFCHGSRLCRDSKMLGELNPKPSELATLAIIEKEEDRMPLILAGIDECLMEQNYEEYLFHSIERAMVGHTLRQNKKSQHMSGRILIQSIDNTRINLVTYQLEERGYSIRVASDLEEARNHVKDPFDMVFADYDIDNPEEFRSLRELFYELPVIALCDDIVHGQQAIVDGAGNYLCMPPTKEDIQMILELATSHIKIK
ncbi:MAG: PilZ domain-containing protein [Sedimentisphaerales bacterium]|nr:PilZ domain-containing protein [Sedimentisphaerales bacterium]